MSKHMPAAGQGRRRWWYLVLLLPFLATLFPQIYNSMSPPLAGLPFFYWYQLAWVIVTGLLTIMVYYLVR